MPIAPLNNAAFTAEWPKGMEPTWAGTITKRIWDAASIVLFPIGLARLAYWELQSWAGRVIHPATTWKTEFPLETQIEDNGNKVSKRVTFDSTTWKADIARGRLALQNAGGTEVSYKTPDGETINAMLFKGTGANRGGIVKAFGNNTGYVRSGEAFLSFVRKHVGDDVDVLLVDTRGCGKSTGETSKNGMALDTYSGGEYLVNKRSIDPNRVFFYGHSLGGYSAVAGAGLFQKMHPDARVSAASDRSFSSLAEAARVIFNRMASWLITFLDWDLNAQKAWESLTGYKIVIYSKQDGIPYACSFHHYVRQAPSNNKVFEVEMNQPNDAEIEADVHCREFTEEEGQEIGSRIRKALHLSSNPSEASA